MAEVRTREIQEKNWEKKKLLMEKEKRQQEEIWKKRAERAAVQKQKAEAWVLSLDWRTYFFISRSVVLVCLCSILYP